MDKSEARHTAGPWHVEDARGSGGGPWDRLCISSGNLPGSGEVVICELNSMIADVVANAQLMAASPDLYAALEAIVQHEATGEFHTWARKIEAARVAIAKARTGGQG